VIMIIFIVVPKAKEKFRSAAVLLHSTKNVTLTNSHFRPKFLTVNYFRSLMWVSRISLSQLISSGSLHIVTSLCGCETERRWAYTPLIMSYQVLVKLSRLVRMVKQGHTYSNTRNFDFIIVRLSHLKEGSTVVPPYPLVQYPRFTAAPPKIGKLKK
jgi:hypothetical protein